MFNSKPIEVGEIQQWLGTTGNIVAIGILQSIIVQACVFIATMHHEAVLGNTSKAQFVTAFECNETFSVEFTR